MFKKQPLLSRGSLQLSWFSFFLVAAVATNARTEQPFLGPIPVQFVTPGKKLVLDMHRFFHPGASAKLDFETNDHIGLAFDSTAFQLRARPQKAGLFDVELSTPSGKNRLVTVLTVAATSGPPSHHFSFKPTDPATKVYLSGSFNGWSNDKTPPTTPDKNGEYTVDLPLEPGRYAYKFLVDGKWMLDPANPQTEDNGLGDKNSIVTIAGEKHYSKLELAQAFLMSIDGVPMVYYGDEIGMTGAGDPDNRRDMRFDDQVSADEKRVLTNFQKLGAIRREHPALRYGSRRTIAVDHDVYAFVRAHLDDRVVAIFNRGKTDAKIDMNVSPELSDGDYADALTGKSVQVKDGKMEFTLPAQTAAFVTRMK
jgi:1,4-alpha-glucan branching enzyme